MLLFFFCLRWRVRPSFSFFLGQSNWLLRSGDLFEFKCLGLQLLLRLGGLLHQTFGECTYSKHLPSNRVYPLAEGILFFVHGLVYSGALLLDSLINFCFDHVNLAVHGVHETFKFFWQNDVLQTLHRTIE